MSLKGAVGKELSCLRRDLRRQQSKVAQLKKEPVVRNYHDWDRHLDSETKEKQLICRYIEKANEVDRMKRRMNALTRERKEFAGMKRQENLKGFVIDEEDDEMDTKDHAAVDKSNIISDRRSTRAQSIIQ